MGAVKVTDLPSDNIINPTDAFFKSNADGATYQISGQTLINQFSGLKGAFSLGNGTSLLNYSDGTNLYFNSLAGTLISTTYNDSTKTVNLDFTDYAITANKLGYNGAVLQFANFQQAIRLGTSTYSSWVNTGASITITPMRSNSIMLIRATGVLGSYAGLSYVTVNKSTNGATSQLTLPGSYAWATVDSTNGNNVNYVAQEFAFEIADVANSSNPITYDLVYKAGWSGVYAYIGASWNFYANINPSSPYYALVPTTLTVTEIFQR